MTPRLREKTLLEMQDKFHLSRYPQRIECFDNSQLSGMKLSPSWSPISEGPKTAAATGNISLTLLKGETIMGLCEECSYEIYKRPKRKMTFLTC